MLIWKVNADNSSLTQVFNYLKLSSNVFGRDGSEYNYNTAFADGFDITGDGRLPINMVYRIGGSRLDLVSVDDISITQRGFRLSESWRPSMNADGDRFCFLAPSIPPQIWMGSIISDGLSSELKISSIKFEPNFVLKDATRPTTIEALVSDINHPIQVVFLSLFKMGILIVERWGLNGRSMDS